MKKRLIIALMIGLLAALPFFALLGSFSRLDGGFCGAEYELLTLNGERYALFYDHEPLIRGALLGTLPYGAETALIFRAKPLGGMGEGEYICILTFRDGAYYKKL